MKNCSLHGSSAETSDYIPKIKTRGIGDQIPPGQSTVAKKCEPLQSKGQHTTDGKTGLILPNLVTVKPKSVWKLQHKNVEKRRSEQHDNKPFKASSLSALENDKNDATRKRENLPEESEYLLLPKKVKYCGEKFKACFRLEHSHLPYSDVPEEDVAGIYKIAYKWQTIYIGETPTSIRSRLIGHMSGTDDLEIGQFLIALPTRDKQMNVTVFWLDRSMTSHSCQGNNFLHCFEKIEGKMPKFNQSLISIPAAMQVKCSDKSMRSDENNTRSGKEKTESSVRNGSGANREGVNKQNGKIHQTDMSMKLPSVKNIQTISTAPISETEDSKFSPNIDTDSDNVTDLNNNDIYQALTGWNDEKYNTGNVLPALSDPRKMAHNGDPNSSYSHRYKTGPFSRQVQNANSQMGMTEGKKTKKNKNNFPAFNGAQNNNNNLGNKTKYFQTDTENAFVNKPEGNDGCSMMKSQKYTPPECRDSLNSANNNRIVQSLNRNAHSNRYVPRWNSNFFNHQPFSAQGNIASQNNIFADPGIFRHTNIKTFRSSGNGYFQNSNQKSRVPFHRPDVERRHFRNGSTPQIHKPDVTEKTNNHSETADKDNNQNNVNKSDIISNETSTSQTERSNPNDLSNETIKKSISPVKRQDRNIWQCSQQWIRKDLHKERHFSDALLNQHDDKQIKEMTNVQNNLKQPENITIPNTMLYGSHNPPLPPPVWPRRVRNGKYS